MQDKRCWQIELLMKRWQTTDKEEFVTNTSELTQMRTIEYMGWFGYPDRLAAIKVDPWYL